MSLEGQKEITVNGLTFVPWISEEKVQIEVQRLGAELTRDYRDKKPIIIGILNGAFIFMSDLVRQMDFVEFCVEFCRVYSYEGTQSKGQITQLIGLKECITDRHVILVEDIIDTGVTIHSLLKSMSEQKPASIKVCTLFLKPANLKVDLKPDYIGFTIPPKFILGYGLDLDGYARNLKGVWVNSKIEKEIDNQDQTNQIHPPDIETISH